MSGGRIAVGAVEDQRNLGGGEGGGGSDAEDELLSCAWEDGYRGVGVTDQAIADIGGLIGEDGGNTARQGKRVVSGGESTAIDEGAKGGCGFPKTYGTGEGENGGE